MKRTCPIWRSPAIFRDVLTGVSQYEMAFSLILPSAPGSTPVREYFCFSFYFSFMRCIPLAESWLIGDVEDVKLGTLVSSGRGTYSAVARIACIVLLPLALSVRQGLGLGDSGRVSYRWHTPAALLNLRSSQVPRSLCTLLVMRWASLTFEGDCIVQPRNLLRRSSQNAGIRLSCYFSSVDVPGSVSW